MGVLLAWGRTVYKEFELLAGKSAPHEFLQLVIYKALTFSDDIVKIDTVRAYHVRILSPILVFPRLMPRALCRVARYVFVLVSKKRSVFQVLMSSGLFCGSRRSDGGGYSPMEGTRP